MPETTPAKNIELNNQLDIVIKDCDIFDNKKDKKKSRNNLRRAKK